MTRQKTDAKIVAIDIPSGLDADTGIANDPTVIADYTLHFTPKKIGFTKPDSAKYLGTVHVHDIGIPTIKTDD